ncbi:MAG: hypothetical protein KDD09_06640 [Phaeodactylibacter sp.]|nr:hypothetical protein [Phaeodactylibacter sp.]
MQQLLDINLPGSILQHRLEETPVGWGEGAVEHNPFTENAVVEGQLGRHNTGQVLIFQIFGAKHRLAVGINEFFALFPAIGPHGIRGQQPVFFQAHRPYAQLVDDGQPGIAILRKIGHFITDEVFPLSFSDE